MTVHFFHRAKLLPVLNVLAVGLAMAAISAAIFNQIFDMPVWAVAPPTFLLGCAWAAVLRWRASISRTGFRWGWLLSLPLAATNAALVGALWFPTLGGSDSPLSMGLIGAALGVTFGAFFWVPALVVTLIGFGVPIAWSQRLASRGLAGEERGEIIVGIVAALMSVLGAFLIRPIELMPERARDGYWLLSVFTIACVALGITATILACIRESKRRALVAKVKAGEVPGMRIDATAEGPALVRVWTAGEGYRAADLREAVCLLDESGRVTHARSFS